MRTFLYRILVTLVNIFFPPLAVAMLAGARWDCMLNCVLFLCGVLPSHVHGFYVSCTYFHRRGKVKKGRYPGGPRALIHSTNVLNGGATNAEVAVLYAREYGLEKRASSSLASSPNRRRGQRRRGTRGGGGGGAGVTGLHPSRNGAGGGSRDSRVGLGVGGGTGDGAGQRYDYADGGAMQVHRGRRAGNSRVGRGGYELWREDGREYVSSYRSPGDSRYR